MAHLLVVQALQQVHWALPILVYLELQVDHGPQ